MNLPKIINIQRFSIHDGEGIRTAVFFKGCLLHCWWCHNPESQRYSQELMFYRERCVGCAACVQPCPRHAIDIEGRIACTNREKCTLCKTCLDVCIHNAREVVGEEYTVAQLVKEIEKDQIFYEESSGGVTLSGGEVMTQNLDYLEELVKRLKRKGFHIAIDTCGHAPYENYLRLLPHVDIFLYDIKTMDNECHKKYMGEGNELILRNLKGISDAGAKINIRIPIVEGVNADERSIGEMIAFLKQNIKVSKVNLLPYHNTGSSKYENLDIEYRGMDFKAPTPEKMEKLVEEFAKNGFHNTKNGG